MSKYFKKITSVIILVFIFSFTANSVSVAQSKKQDDRMKWFREARLGMFIHWGLYSIPAGEWGDRKGDGEWIRTTAQIPVETYDKFVQQFNPVKFNAEEWVKAAKNAGMKYIVITTKHHDGFCLFDSKYTDFDVMSTPFKRDIMKELSDAAHKEGIKICWYHSIMDWHYPDYLPRRDWEKDRSTEGADFRKYVDHLKDQLKELVTKYGDIGILWFDGEWEATWNHKYGKEIYDYVRSLQPSIIVNNRVDVGRSGMAGLTMEGEYVGDYGTPEQEIPATGLPGVDWETCMTMNDHWGYNKNDNNWKSEEDLIQKLADIASKGGNFLLNVGPTSEGLFPEASIERLKAMGDWMKVYGEAIYGTKASPFKSLAWGRCTQKAIAGGTRLYLHVFNWPQDGKLVLPGIFNTPKQVYLLSDAKKTGLKAERKEDAIIISLPVNTPDKINSVVVVDIKGKPDISNPPAIISSYNQFIDEIKVNIKSDREKVVVHYTTDGSVPNEKSLLVKNPVTIKNTATITARCFRDGKAVSGTVSETFTKVPLQPAVNAEKTKSGLKYNYYEGTWDKIPDFTGLKVVQSGIVPKIDLAEKKIPEYFAFGFSGLIKIEKDNVYKFFIESDDGSILTIDDKFVVDNDGLHGMIEKSGTFALAKGYHKIAVKYLQKTGGNDLKVSIESPNMKKQIIPSSLLFN
jgi:alpha-L-fucosidase